jgi:hypothetical protein
MSASVTITFLTILSAEPCNRVFTHLQRSIRRDFLTLDQNVPAMHFPNSAISEFFRQTAGGSDGAL